MKAERKNLFAGIVLGTALVVLLQLGGCLLLRGPGRELGFAMFLAVPFVSGFAVAAMVRHTTIGTRLYPRWYWRPLERWGVTSEHDFVFANLHRWTDP